MSKASSSPSVPGPVTDVPTVVPQEICSPVWQDQLGVSYRLTNGPQAGRFHQQPSPQKGGEDAEDSGYTLREGNSSGGLSSPAFRSLCESNQEAHILTT